jgi:hypothetical protein
MKAVEENLRKVVLKHQRNWDKRLHLFMLPYRVSTKEITGMPMASMVIGRELYLSCELVVRTPTNKEHPRINYMTDLVEWLCNIHHYAHQHLKVASNRMKDSA